MAARRLAIIGAGPIGLEAALAATEQGFAVEIFDRGALAANVANWGHVKLFSPLGLNASARGKAALAAVNHTFPTDDVCLTGLEYREQYLLPLSRLPRIADGLRLQSEVRCISRVSLLKGEEIGTPTRGDDGFRLLIQDCSNPSETKERESFAEIVLDCSGTYGQPRSCGPGGGAAIGARDHLHPEHCTLPDVMGQDRRRFANRSTLVIGGGYSAATAVVALAELAREAPATRVIWLTRGSRDFPLSPLPNDALAERDQLITSANSLAIGNDSPVSWVPARTITHIDRARPEGKWRLRTRPANEVTDSITNYQVDEFLSLVGYQPDWSFAAELQIHLCYASAGPMKLAASLLGETSADCLAQSVPGAATLLNPEPNYFVLGSKSYGRDSRFLIRNGLAQVDLLFEEILNAVSSKTGE